MIIPKIYKMDNEFDSSTHRVFHSLVLVIYYLIRVRNYDICRIVLLEIKFNVNHKFFNTSAHPKIQHYTCLLFIRQHTLKSNITRGSYLFL